MKYLKYCFILILIACDLNDDRFFNKGQYGSNTTRYSLRIANEWYSPVLKDNPIILSGNKTLSPLTAFDSFLAPEAELIVENKYLQGTCYQDDGTIERNNCYAVIPYDGAAPIEAIDNSWAFDTGSEEFWQVQTFYHTRKILDFFQDELLKAYKHRQENPDIPSAIPSNLYSSSANWDKMKTLRVFSHCDLTDNSFYSSSEYTICYGRDSVYTNMLWVQDPTVIYHETGHAITQIMMNLRNGSLYPLKSNLGFFNQDEAGALGEGLSDYFSYLINGRTHVGEWAMGRTIKSSRPMSESDEQHINGLDKKSGARLSYPDFLNYDSNNYNALHDDMHLSGQIISHYLVALTEDIQTFCEFDSDESKNNEISRKKVLEILIETFAELGDLTCTGTNGANGCTVNLNEENAQDWIRLVNPINFRSISQKIARNTYKLLNEYNDRFDIACKEPYPTKNIETLLDDYGLLLFNSYGKNEMSIDINNRRKTRMVSKDAIDLDYREGKDVAFIFDNRMEIFKYLEYLRGKFKMDLLSEKETDPYLRFNNDTGKVGPGEVFGVSVNILNQGNIRAGGVQILANDWDHIRDGKICNNFNDKFPEVAENGKECLDVTVDNREVAPVCFLMDINDSTNAKWITQDEYMTQNKLDQARCLDPSNPKACYIRVVSGADGAYYSMIDSNKVWYETFFKDIKPTFNYENLILFEVSPWLKQGTTVNCRLRARFTNCTDCFEDNSEFEDYKYSGAGPFKVFNFRFVVTD